MNGEVMVSAWAVLPEGSAPDVSFVPPLVRRRFSPLQKLFFALANAVGSAAGDEVVFASRDGEDTLTRRIIEDFQADGSVSPNRFSTSVYNAAPGLWSVLMKNRATYTAVAAGDDSLECGLLETVGCAKPRTFVYAEETGNGYGAAVRLGANGTGRRVMVSDAPVGGPSVSFSDWCDFLSGRTHELTGRWLKLRDLG
ncbi:MAG: beta-ketoacyl synthase chain length factor [Kiritimatiellae bacterium]|nr:beta-ketoacyl synthase chain length factor [Kiritimatiellia bacterium]